MIDVKISFTAQAKAAVDKTTTTWESIPVPPELAYMLPITGDLFTTLSLDPLVFVVVERHYRVEPDRTTVHILLDLADPPDELH